MHNFNLYQLSEFLGGSVDKDNCMQSENDLWQDIETMKVSSVISFLIKIIAFFLINAKTVVNFGVVMVRSTQHKYSMNEIVEEKTISKDQSANTVFSFTNI